MKKFIMILVASLLLVSPVGAENLRIKFTLPTMDNAGTCSNPILVAMGSNPALRGHWRWWVAGGDSLGGAVEDSLLAPPGASILRDYQVAANLYRAKAWASDAGGVGCDTTVTIRILALPPAEPKWSN